ncbi:hypothetical protein [Sphingomonas sp. YR710]|uniref:hypothetical protein n=1 Tax=Sphingomonas sp. YR710 TaxID=1882773 RepID=UPI000B84EACE|nr:hypothetical protein [Sphingomonas sp. YR710]
MRFILIGSLLFVAGAPSLAATDEKPNPTTADLAHEVSASMAPREQMRAMVLAAISQSTTAAIIVKQIGQEKAASLIRDETGKVVDRYGPEWAENLASSYQAALTPQELQAAKQAFLNRDRAAIMPLMMKVGPIMQAKTEPLLKKAATEALAAAFEQVGKGAAK